MKISIIPLLLIGVVVTGCASITKGTTQAVMVVTPGAEGAECRLFSPSIGERIVTTPGSVVLSKGQDSIQVNCTRRCFRPGAGIIGSNVEVMTAGNLVLGGVIGLGVDAATGAMNKYDNAVQIMMTPIPGCRA